MKKPTTRYISNKFLDLQMFRDMVSALPPAKFWKFRKEKKQEEEIYQAVEMLIESYIQWRLVDSEDPDNHSVPDLKLKHTYRLKARELDKELDQKIKDLIKGKTSD